MAQGDGQPAPPIRIGVIGTGAMGSDHAMKLAHGVSGATVFAVTDVDRARAEQVASAVGGATVFTGGHELIEAPEVDAVLVASIAETHADFTLACIAAGKPVLCEKPLARTSAECVRILDAEVARGARLAMIGFMRRFDPGYLAVRAARLDGRIGAPLMLHNVHRTAAAGESFTTSMTITEAMIHEFDITRWMLDDEVTAIQLIPPTPSPKVAPGLQDPQFAAMHTSRGMVSTISFFANSTYGYDVRCELVGSEGVASLVNPVTSSAQLANVDAQPIPATWSDRFRAAYRDELQAWVAGLRRGEVTGPSAWDGYTATCVAEAGVEAVRTGQRITVDYIEKPALYA